MVKNLKNSLLVMLIIFSGIFFVFCKQEYVCTRNMSSSRMKKLRKKGNHQTNFPRICTQGVTRLIDACDLTRYFDNKVHAELSTDNCISVEGKQYVFNSQDVVPECESSYPFETIKQNGWLSTKSLVEYTLEYSSLCRMDGKASGNIWTLPSEQTILNFAEECCVEELIISFEKCVHVGDSIMESYFGQYKTENRNYYKENFNNKLTFKILFSNLYDDFQIKDCVGISKQQFLVLEQNSKSKWINFYDQKILFEFQKGFEHQIRVEVTQIKNSSVDVSSQKYSLNEIVDRNIINNSTSISTGVFVPSLLNNKQSPKIDQNKKYFVDEIVEKNFSLNDCGSKVIFPPLYDESIVINFLQSLRQKYTQVKVEVTGESLTHMANPQSPNTLDSTGLVFSGNNEYRAYNNTVGIMILENEPSISIPTISLDDRFVLSFGDELMESQFLGPFHFKENLVIYSPTHEAAMVIDLFNPVYAPEMGFGVTIDIDWHMKSHDVLVENFNAMFLGHHPFLGTKEPNQADKEFVWAAMDQTKQSIDLTSQDQIVEICV